ncbi:calcium-binding and coiled-coil domain-containing protein 1-like isoform X2 [Bacillus rossius redtenbacheri]|uniref:calcium-binding and coiled-coil domain-containing protein 1-like isoform X2 n=1 Tax=Bacillus rossius redtenbacheri TaxID=93214 RepID=UPI002FDE60B9
MVTQVTDDDMHRLSSNMNDMTISFEEFSMPYISGLSSQSLLERSQYGKVIFHEIQDSYPTDADVLCKYTLTEGVSHARGDRINIYKVGWRQAADFFHSMWAPQPAVSGQSEFQVLFKASSMPKDDQIYQFCYMTAGDEMRGASGPFQFHQPYDNDLCTVEEQDGLVIVRSRSSVAEERLREAQQTSLTLQKEKSEVEGQLQQFTKMLALKNKEKDDVLSRLSAVAAEKQELAKRLDECAHLERHMERLQKELQALDAEKMEMQAKLQKAEAQIQALTASLESLTSVSQQLREAARGALELGQLRGKLEDQQYTINVLTSSKEMITNELRLEINANEKHQSLIKTLTDEKKELEEKIGAFEKRIIESDRLVGEALQIEQTSLAELNKLREENVSLKELLEQLARDSQREVKFAKEVEQLKAAKEALQLALEELQQRMEQEKREHAKETSSLKELLGQLAKDGQREASLTQELEQLRAEKQALQREKSEQAKETKSLRGLLEQLAKDSKREVGLAQEIELLKTEKQAAQQAAEELRQEKAENSRKHDSMLAELIRLTGKEKSSELQLAQLSSELAEAAEELSKLRDVKAESEDVKCLADMALSRATLQRRVEQLEAEEKISNKRVIVLQDRIELLQKETIRLQNLVDARNGPSKENCFGELFSSLEQQKLAAEAQLGEARDCEREQLERQESISARIDEMAAETEALDLERGEVQQTYLASSAELGKLRERFQTLSNQSSGFTSEVDDWTAVGSPLELSRVEDEMRDAECFVESSHMRIMQLEQRRQELGQERAVLAAQHQAAVERAHRHGEERKAAQRRLAAVEESERILLREHLDVVIAPAGADASGDGDKVAVLSKLEDTAAIAQNGGEGAQELALRLKLAAAEYRKLYAEKQKADRRLRKLYQRLGNKEAGAGVPAAEVPTAELVNISGAADSNSSSQTPGGATSFSFVCPVCSSSFPRGGCEVFMEHFDNHLS